MWVERMMTWRFHHQSEYSISVIHNLIYLAGGTNLTIGRTSTVINLGSLENLEIVMGR